MKILISILSDQTIPNVQLIKEIPNIDKHIFFQQPKWNKKALALGFAIV